MTSYDTSGNVETEVEDISTYTIGTSGTISDATFLRFLAKADDRVSVDAPSSMTQEQLNEANALLICHMIYRKTGRTGVTSESVGSASISRKLKSDMTPWMDDYLALINSVKNAPVAISSLSTSGFTRADAVISSLKMDQSSIAELDPEE